MLYLEIWSHEFQQKLQVQWKWPYTAPYFRIILNFFIWRFNMLENLSACWSNVTVFVTLCETSTPHMNVTLQRRNRNTNFLFSQCTPYSWSKHNNNTSHHCQYLLWTVLLWVLLPLPSNILFMGLITAIWKRTEGQEALNSSHSFPPLQETSTKKMSDAICIAGSLFGECCAICVLKVYYNRDCMKVNECALLMFIKSLSFRICRGTTR